MRKLTTTLALLVAAAPLAGAVPSYAAEPWHTVARADVTGDGRADKILLRRVDDSRCQVRVVGAGGHVMTKTLTNDFVSCTWHGAAPLDSRPGSELSVLTTTGAHTQFHSVLTVRGGKLLGQRMPAASDGLWVVDGAALSTAGVQKLRNGHLMSRVAFSDDGDTWHGKRTELAYSKAKNRWVVVKRSSYTTDSAGAHKTAGWHVPGLPRWAG
ncbi:hypothetical protein [Nocardioides speluncae]|uniref:hypothetical protein n=1 Tax=Nocardioides speluncae TaxID=2670337 RepID=UPI000D69FD84|nr:hypothetical protein [Nocardioides speluncae]